MLLYHVILPETEDEKKELYYRSKGNAVVEEGILKLQPSTTVSFDTYFNAFFYSKYLKYTGIEKLIIIMKAKGSFEVEVICIEPTGKETVVEKSLIQNEAKLRIEVSLKDLPNEGAAFCRFTAYEEGEITEIRYESDCATRGRIKVAAIICTYHREEYVKRNIEYIQRKIWDIKTSITDEFDLIVIDNGKTLGPFQNEHIKIVHNVNLGGSGGFTRGIIEALNCGENYTHVLLMDDDISFESEILIRTVQLLKVLKQENNCIGGQMLIDSSPLIQYEAGGRFLHGRLYANGEGLNLSKIADLFQNEKEKETDYNAWWYCCIPIRLIHKFGLPLPFFIKEDDVEFGLRTKSKYFISNGIGVWHQSFEKKQQPYLEYYIKRNELIVSAFSGIGAGTVNSIIKLFRSVIGSLIRKKKSQIAYINEAYIDFLKGPEYLLDTDGEQLNNKLIKNKKRGEKESTVISCIITIKISLLLLLKYEKIKKEYIHSRDKLTSEYEWRKRLKMSLPDKM